VSRRRHMNAQAPNGRSGRAPHRGAWTGAVLPELSHRGEAPDRARPPHGGRDLAPARAGAIRRFTLARTQWILGAALIVYVTSVPAVPADTGPPEFPPARFPAPEMAEIRLGRLLFYDPVLSGNRDIACATCHHPRFATSDGLSLGLGEGGVGLGPERHDSADNPPDQLIPRNAPALFNLGAAQFTAMFHDGRIEADPGSPHGMRSPVGADMLAGFDGPLAAQAMFPVIAPDEMAGRDGENPVARAVSMGLITGEGGAWALIAGRVAALPAYREGFGRVLGPGAPIAFTDIANAIGAFIAWEWRADDSPFDRHLAGRAELPPEAAAGMRLFYGKAGCAACHSGRFQTDHDYHAIAMPQIGPGKVARFEAGRADLGRMRVTGRAEDAYRFRTPPLRNVAETAPYGHDGAYATLEGVIRHHLDPLAALAAYDPSQAVLPESAAIPAPMEVGPEERARIAVASELAPVALSADSLDSRLGVPETVPSGLTVAGAQP